MSNETAKTNNMAAEIAKINEEMTRESKKVEEAYSRIGKLYVALHASNYESEFRPMFAVIEQAENAIRNCRVRVRDIRGVVCCDKCGTDVPKGVAFCSVCGSPMPGHTPAVDHSSMVKCTVCGKLVDKNASFCTSCGMPMKRISEKIAEPDKVEAPASASAPVAVEIPAPASVVEVPPLKDEAAPAPVEIPTPASVGNVCTRCGAQMKHGMLFCTSCGQKLDPAPVPTPVPVVAPVTKVCANCGKELVASARFCVGCGARQDG